MESAALVRLGLSLPREALSALVSGDLPFQALLLLHCSLSGPSPPPRLGPPLNEGRSPARSWTMSLPL